MIVTNPRHMNLRVGDTIGDYEILGVLGAGGMGRVFRVRNLISDRVDAMKVVLPGLVTDAAIGERFLREIKVHASLVHPHIAGLHTAVHFQDSYLMIMELVEGRSLDEALRGGGPLQPAAAVDAIQQVLAALSYAHGHGVIHRDIKPANIIVRADGVVKVTDFGIARSSVTPQLTAPGLVLGSLYYMSPEQIRAMPIDERSDLYSVGVTLYEILTGRRPFEGANEYEIMKAHLETMPVSPDLLVPQIGPEISRVILRALAKDPAARFQNAQEFRAALGHGTLSTDTDAPRTAPPDPAALPAAGRDDIAAIQAMLIPYLGPITPRLVAKAASRNSSSGMLVQELAGHIPNLRDREAFLKACQPRLGPTQASTVLSARTPVPAEAPPRANWDGEYLEKVKQALTSHIGPVAGLLVDRTSKKVASREQLYEALMSHIPSEKDRAKFLQSVPR